MAKAREAGAGGGVCASAAPRAKKRRKKEIKLTPREKEMTGEGIVPTNWRDLFLAALAETSSVTLSAQRAGTVPLRAYKVRRGDAEFAARWQAAVREGYDNLEMEALSYLRDPTPARKFEVTAALRMLAARARKVERGEDEDESLDEEALFESIDSMIEQIRERRAADDTPTSATGERDDDDAR